MLDVSGDFIKISEEKSSARMTCCSDGHLAVTARHCEIRLCLLHLGLFRVQACQDEVFETVSDVPRYAPIGLDRDSYLSCFVDREQAIHELSPRVLHSLG